MFWMGGLSGLWRCLCGFKVIPFFFPLETQATVLKEFNTLALFNSINCQNARSYHVVSRPFIQFYFLKSSEILLKNVWFRIMFLGTNNFKMCALHTPSRTNDVHGCSKCEYENSKNVFSSTVTKGRILYRYLKMIKIMYINRYQAQVADISSGHRYIAP